MPKLNTAIQRQKAVSAYSTSKQYCLSTLHGNINGWQDVRIQLNFFSEGNFFIQMVEVAISYILGQICQMCVCVCGGGGWFSISNRYFRGRFSFQNSHIYFYLRVFSTSVLHIRLVSYLHIIIIDLHITLVTELHIILIIWPTYHLDNWPTCHPDNWSTHKLSNWSTYHVIYTHKRQVISQSHVFRTGAICFKRCLIS